MGRILIGRLWAAALAALAMSVSASAQIPIQLDQTPQIASPTDSTVIAGQQPSSPLGNIRLDTLKAYILSNAIPVTGVTGLGVGVEPALTIAPNTSGGFATSGGPFSVANATGLTTAQIIAALGYTPANGANYCALVGGSACAFSGPFSTPGITMVSNGSIYGSSNSSFYGVFGGPSGTGGYIGVWGSASPNPNEAFLGNSAGGFTEYGSGVGVLSNVNGSCSLQTSGVFNCSSAPYFSSLQTLGGATTALAGQAVNTSNMPVIVLRPEMYGGAADATTTSFTFTGSIAGQVLSVPSPGSNTFQVNDFITCSACAQNTFIASIGPVTGGVATFNLGGINTQTIASTTLTDYRWTGTDNSAAFTAMENGRQSLSPFFGNVRAEFVFSRGMYLLNTPQTFVADQNHTLFMDGAGPMVDGSRFIAGPTITSCPTGLLAINGAVSASGSAIDIKNFMLLNGAPATCSTGLYTYNLNNGAVFYSPVRSIWTSAFQNSFYFRDSRLIHGYDLAGWAKNVPNAVVYNLTNDSAQGSGDMIFDGAYAICGYLGAAGARNATPSGCYGVELQTTPSNGSLEAGIQFHALVTEDADFAVEMNCAVTGANINDIWFDGGTQFDDNRKAPWQIQSTASECGINDLHFNHIYYTALNENAGYTGLISGYSPSQPIDEVFINDSIFSGMATGLQFSNVNAAHVSDNDFSNFGTSTNGEYLFGGTAVTNSDFHHNNATYASSVTYFAEFDSTSTVSVTDIGGVNTNVFHNQPRQLPSVALSALPTCGVQTLGQEAIVAGVATPSYSAALTSGAWDAPAMCIYNGSSYLWTYH